MATSQADRYPAHEWNEAAGRGEENAKLHGACAGNDRSVQDGEDSGNAEDVGQEQDETPATENFSDSLLLMSLSKFYTRNGNIEKIIPVINCVSDVSLRLLDWFVTNYAKKNNIYITKALNDGSVSYFNVYLNYRAQLKAYSKQHFDPFRRRDRIEYYFDKDKSIQTTIGQLNFFRWVLQNDILSYIEEHAAEIEADMMKNKARNKAARRRRRSDTNGDRKRDVVHDDEEEKDGTELADANDDDHDSCDECGTEEDRAAAAAKKERGLSSTDSADNGSSVKRRSTPLERKNASSGRVIHITGNHIVRFD